MRLPSNPIVGLVMLLYILGSLAFSGFAMYAIVHFIMKYW